MNLTAILISAVAFAQASASPAALPAAVASASPAPAPAAATAGSAEDPCADDRGHTSMLPAIDRPTLGFSTCAVKRRDALVELGYGRVSGPGVSANQYGQGIVRLGVAQNVEADILGPALISQAAPVSASGYADSGLGVKWELQHDAANSAAVDFLYTVPNGGGAFSAGVPTQTFNFDYSRSLGNFGLAGTLGFVHASTSSFVPSLVFSNQFNANAQWFVEGFGTASQGQWQTGEDAGVQFLLTPSIELDLEGSRTNVQGGPVNSAGFGFGFLF